MLQINYKVFTKYPIEFNIGQPLSNFNYIHKYAFGNTNNAITTLPI